MVPICTEWWCTEANEATQTRCYNPVAPAYPIWAYYVHGQQRRCQEDPVKDPVSLPCGRLEKTTRSSPHHVAQHRPTGSETTTPYAPTSSRFCSEPPSVEDDVNVWRYAILSCMPETTTMSLHLQASWQKYQNTTTAYTVKDKCLWQPARCSQQNTTKVTNSVIAHDKLIVKFLFTIKMKLKQTFGWWTHTSNVIQSHSTVYRLINPIHWFGINKFIKSFKRQQAQLFWPMYYLWTVWIRAGI